MMGRPPKIEKIEEVKRMRGAGATMSTLADHFKMDKKSLRRWLKFPEKRLEEWKKYFQEQNT